MSSEHRPAHLPTFDAIRQWPRFTVDSPLKVLVSACIAGVACGADGTSYGAPYPHTERLLTLPNVSVVSFCPEDLALGTPREIPDIDGGNGSQVIYLGNRRNGVYQPGPGVCAALLARHGFPVVSQRDFKTIAAIVHELDPTLPPPADARDHHESAWYRSAFGPS